ncbi:MAG: hypothetical protein H7Y86_03760 [Rhizobacter sp.]|nr:hypothetical protein [Ferruginibacter sp.]
MGKISCTGLLNVEPDGSNSYALPTPHDELFVIGSLLLVALEDNAPWAKINSTLPSLDLIEPLSLVIFTDTDSPLGLPMGVAIWGVTIKSEVSVWATDTDRASIISNVITLIMLFF